MLNLFESFSAYLCELSLEAYLMVQKLFIVIQWYLLIIHQRDSHSGS